MRIEDVKLDMDEFVRYVRIVSNSEIELVNGGDDSEMQKQVKMLWKTLAEEVKNVEKEDQDKASSVDTNMSQDQIDEIIGTSDD